MKKQGDPMKKREPMSDSDAIIINCKDGTERKYWAKKLEVKQEDITSAVNEVGDCLTAVKKHLNDRVLRLRDCGEEDRKKSLAFCVGFTQRRDQTKEPTDSPQAVSEDHSLPLPCADLRAGNIPGGVKVNP